MKSKLKRDRPGENKEERTLFGIYERKIEQKRPSAEDPSIRRFNPDTSAKLLLHKKGLIDWRRDDSGKREVALNDILNKIICGDAVKVLAKFPTKSVDCVITSPPYWSMIDYGLSGQYGQCSYENYLDQLLTVWKECGRILKSNGKLCINTPIMPISKRVMASQHTRHLKNLNNDIERTILEHVPEMNRYSLYIWQKQTTEKMFGSYPYPPNLYEQNTIEFINILVKDGPPEKLPSWVKEASKLNEKEWMNLTKQIWNIYPEDIRRDVHPAPFPKAIPNRLIAMFTFRNCSAEEGDFKGGIVLDPFCGVGATCIAAKELGRNYIGIDLVGDFCIEAAKRLEVTLPSGKICLVDSNAKIKGKDERVNTLYLFQ